MSKQRSTVLLIISGVSMALLILDAKTVLGGAAEGIALCLRTVVPSLFPFLFLSCILSSTLLGTRCALLRPIGKLCGIPEGAESLLILGLLGGYPVGAQAIGTSYANGQLDKKTAQRLLAFCNNAGPSFLFGMVGTLFSNPSAVWLLWLIHILSAILVGILIPKAKSQSCFIPKGTSVTATQALEKSVRIMGNICGWVIIFRVIITLCSRWLLWLLPNTLQVLFAGILELSNGCCALAAIPCQGMRYVLSSLFLSLGGVCVAMQTASVTPGISKKFYFCGKLLQGALSFTFAAVLQPILFTGTDAMNMPPIYIIFILIIAVLIYVLAHCGKKVVAIQNTMMYNSSEC